MILEGDVPSPIDPPEGCRFCPRSGLEYSDEVLKTKPPFLELEQGHWVEACPACVPDARLV